MRIFIVLMKLFLLIPNKEAISLVKEKKGAVIYEFSFNKASAYELVDGRIIIFPQQGDSSMLFAKKNDFLNFINDPIFPEPLYDPFYNYKTNLQNIKGNIQIFLNQLNNRLKISLGKVDSKSDVVTIFDSLNSYCKRNDDFLETLFVPTGILIGEYLAKTNDLTWHLNTVYTFTPYLIPALKNKMGIEFTIWSFLDDYFEAKHFDPNDFFFELESYDKINKANFPKEIL